MHDTWAITKTTRNKVVGHSSTLMGLNMKVWSIHYCYTVIHGATGSWASDQRNGKGLYTYANSDSYDGDWCDNLRHGQGTYVFADTGAKVCCL